MRMPMSAFLPDSGGSGSTSASVSVRGRPSLALCYVHSCSCASACSELVLVNLCCWWSSVIHRRRDPSLCVVVSVLGLGFRVFCMHTSAHAGVSIPSCQQGLARHLCSCISQGSAFPGIFLLVFVHRDQCML